MTATPLWPGPVNLAAAPGDGQVALSWKRNAQIARYQVHIQSRGATFPVVPVPPGSGENTTCTITGLTNGTEYIFTVQAAEISGTGTGHAAIVSAAPVPVPAAPTGLAAIPAERQAVLTWDYPSNPTITGYQYRQAEGEGSTNFGDWMDIIGRNAHATTYTVTGLTNGIEYVFAVRARTRSGTGLAAIAIATPLLSVRFGAAANEADESGEAVAVEVTLSQKATVPLEIPIRLSPNGESVAADYAAEGLGAGTAQGVAGTLAFGVGDDTKSFTITANQDEDVHDETVILGFGVLPAGAEEGDPAAATLTITDDEGAAVRACFRRLNDEILSKHVLTIADVTNRAIGARMDDPCGKKAAAYTLAGGSTLYDTLRSNAQAIEDGTLSLDDVLAG